MLESLTNTQGVIAKHDDFAAALSDALARTNHLFLVTE
jgi:hypothetical protein